MTEYLPSSFGVIGTKQDEKSGIRRSLLSVSVLEVIAQRAVSLTLEECVESGIATVTGSEAIPIFIAQSADLGVTAFSADLAIIISAASVKSIVTAHRRSPGKSITGPEWAGEVRLVGSLAGQS
jgi:hypothetical protein